MALFYLLTLPSGWKCASSEALITAGSSWRIFNMYSLNCKVCRKIFCTIILLQRWNVKFFFIMVRKRGVMFNETSRWTSLIYFHGYSDTIHILGCHSQKLKHVWRGFTNITKLTKIFKPLWNWSVVWKSCTKSKVKMCSESALRGHKTLIIAKKYLHSNRTLSHTPPMHD